MSFQPFIIIRIYILYTLAPFSSRPSLQGHWSLSLDETVACLHMCLLMSRDDLFFRWTLLSGHPTSVCRAHRTGVPLMIAASYGRTLLVNLLLARGANPIEENADGVTAIQMALESNCEGKR